jgi:DNA repair protein SbcD/Mre11
MRIAHLADLHLGFRAYHRLGAGGINARERDVAQAFRSALDSIILAKPDLIVIAGDVFHSVRPSNSAIADAFRQFMRLRTALPYTPIVLIAGDHDSPRSVETGSILRLFAEIPGIAAADDAARTVHLPTIDTSVLCVPRNSLLGAERIALEPDPEASTNVLLMHASVTGTGIEDELRFLHDYGGPEVESSEIQPERWDYVALGHYHIATPLANNMWYAGAIERTSRNIWREVVSEKGYVMYDTSTRKAELVPITTTRTVIDLKPFSARVRAGMKTPDGETPPQYMSAPEIDAKIRQLVDNIRDGIAGKIVRLVINDVPRELFRELDHRQIRDYKAEALHFHLDARRPDVTRIVARGSFSRRRTLDEEVEEFLAEHWQISSDRIDGERLALLARKYLDDAARDVDESLQPSP